MKVQVIGNAEGGEQRRLTWQLTAPDGHGPEIPCRATVLLACKLVNGELSRIGAFPCLGFLKLEGFNAEFQRWAITFDITEETL